MNNPITLNKIEFVIGDFYAESSNSNTNSFCLANDSSLLYQSAIYGNYSILLGGNWRFELIVDSHTCLCIKFQSSALPAKALRLSCLYQFTNVKPCAVRRIGQKLQPKLRLFMAKRTVDFFHGKIRMRFQKFRHRSIILRAENRTSRIIQIPAFFNVR